MYVVCKFWVVPDDALRDVRVKILEAGRHVCESRQAVGVEVLVLHSGDVVLDRSNENEDEHSSKRHVLQQTFLEPRHILQRLKNNKNNQTLVHEYLEKVTQHQCKKKIFFYDFVDLFAEVFILA